LPKAISARPAARGNAEIVDSLARRPNIGRAVLVTIEAYFGLTPGSSTTLSNNLVEVNGPTDRLLFELAEDLHARLNLLEEASSSRA
jgi:hypothetical protein